MPVPSSPAPSPADAQAPGPRKASGSPKFNLILMGPKEGTEHHGDFVEAARFVRELAPDIEPFVVRDKKKQRWRIDLARRPTMVFAPTALRRWRPWRGRVFAGEHLSKSEEMTMLGEAGFPVPKWRRLTEHVSPDLESFSRYVVMKPDVGLQGSEVRIVRKGRAKWRVPKTKVAGRPSTDWVVQEFVRTGPWPISYRVTTLFGDVLFAWRVEADRDRRPLNEVDDFSRHGGISISSTGKGCGFTLIDDEEVLGLARHAHGAFPEIPLLGFDILRDSETGQLSIIEVNASGQTWHFSSSMGKDLAKDFGIDLYEQFGGMRRVAEILIDQTRRTAR